MNFADQSRHLTFIGTGNMANAIIGGLCAAGYPRHLLHACGPDAAQRAALEQAFGITTADDNTAFLTHSDALILCVKPQIMESVCRVMAPALPRPAPVILSIAAGIPTTALAAWLDTLAPVIRCMPNTPAMVHQGASVLFASESVPSEARELASTIFSAVGQVDWVDQEDLLHAVTALSGSGPAYCFLFLEALEEAGAQLGLPPDLSRRLAIQTLRGAGELAAHSAEEPRLLKQRVMSPGGTTEQAIRQFEQDDFSGLVARALLQAWRRSYTLAGQQAPDVPQAPH